MLNNCFIIFNIYWGFDIFYKDVEFDMFRVCVIIFIGFLTFFIESYSIIYYLGIVSINVICAVLCCEQILFFCTRGGLYGQKMGSHTPIWLCKTYMVCFDLNIHNI